MTLIEFLFGEYWERMSDKEKKEYPFDEFMKDIMDSWNKSQEEKNIISKGEENNNA